MAKYDYVIMTDTTADLPQSFIDKYDIQIMSIPCVMDGVTYTAENPIPMKKFYDAVRNGSLPTTSQANPDACIAKYNEVIDKYDQDILYLAFDSGLSGSCGNAMLAASDLEEMRTDHKVTVIDTLAASMGQGVLVYQACKKRDEGLSLEELAKWVEDVKLNVVHSFTVEDLNHLHRGGRVSKTSAVIGTALNIKPVLYVDEEGHLINVDKVRGRKKSLLALVDTMEKKMGSFKEMNDIVFIGHGDCIEDAEYVAGLVKERFGIDSVIDYVGPTIGAHTGAGLMTLFYMGDIR